MVTLLRGETILTAYLAILT